MTLQLWEHWSKMSNKDIAEEIFEMFLIMIGICIISIILYRIKIKYKDKVENSNSKVLKFIFNNIL